MVFFRLKAPHSTAFKEPGMAASIAGMISDRWVLRICQSDRRQHHYRKTPLGKALLMAEGLIACNQYLDPVVLGFSQEFTVLESCPALEAYGKNLVIAKVLPQSVRKILIEQQFHGLGWPR